MNRHWKTCLVWTACLGLLAPVSAQVRVVPELESRCIFSGNARRIPVSLENVGSGAETLELRIRLYQTATEIAALVSDSPWKRLTVLPGQTILETALLDFPVVQSETGFLVQWLGNAGRVLGTTRVLAYPENSLQGLKALAGDGAVGVFDPQNELKPLLRAAGIAIHDLETTGPERFSGKLAIIGPFRSKDQVPPALAKEMKALAQRNVGIVWICPPAEPNDRLVTSLHLAAAGTALVVVAQNSAVPDLPRNPQSQLHLVELAQVALRYAPFPVPDLHLAFKEPL